MEMRFIKDRQPQVLIEIRNDELKQISLRHMQHLVQHEDIIDWAVECRIMPTKKNFEETKYHLDIQQLRIKHSKVFNDLPPGQPPDRGIEHIIELEEGTKSIMITPYCHPNRLKDEIEKTIQELLD